MTVKIGLIGCGHIAGFHARNIRDAIARHGIPARYDAVCDLDVGRAEAFAKIAGCSLVTTRAQDVIDACEIVYICAETAAHPDLAFAAASAGRHVFCEKPLAKTVADAARMTQAVAEHGVVNQAGLVLRYSPVYAVLADLMREDWGPLLSAHLRDDQFFPVGGQYGSSWRGEFARAGGGTLIEHSIHDVDLYRRLFGEVRAVTCHTRETSGRSGIEDVAEVRFQHADGHATTLSSVWHAVETRQSSRSLEVFFERARFTTDHDYFGTITMEIDDQPAVTLSEEDVIARFLSLQNLDPDKEDHRSLAGLGDRRFLEAATSGGVASPDFAEALRAHAVVAACYRSAADDGAITEVD